MDIADLLSGGNFDRLLLIEDIRKLHDVGAITNEQLESLIVGVKSNQNRLAIFGILTYYKKFDSIPDYETISIIENVAKIQ